MREKCVHRYRKKLLGEKYIVYKCEKPGCKHYISAALIPGRVAECYRCGKPFTVTYAMVRKGKEMLKLHCEDCTKGRKAHADLVDKVLAKIYGSTPTHLD